MKPAYIYIILGFLVASSRFFFEKYNQLLLICGMMLLIVGVYSISKSLPSKKESDFQEPIVPKPPQNNEEDNEKTTS